LLSATRRLALIALLAAAALSSSYALAPVPNVKLMDLFAFVAGYALGLGGGVAVAWLSRLVWATLNPWGSAPLLEVVLLSVGQTIFAVLGWGLARRDGGGQELHTRALLFATAGVGGALVFDLWTWAYGVWVFAQPPLTWLGGLIPFAIVHELANLVFFGAAGPAVVAAVRRLIPPSSTRRLPMQPLLAKPSP
jgi:hypothetical protein